MSDEDFSFDARRACRTSVAVEAGVRRAGVKPFRVQVFDLSPRGCKIEFVERPAVGERVWVRFDGLQSLEAEVRWVAGHIGGVEFERPLHEAVFRQLAT